MLNSNQIRKWEDAMGKGMLHWEREECTGIGEDAMGKGRMQWKGDDAMEK